MVTTTKKEVVVVSLELSEEEAHAIRAVVGALSAECIEQSVRQHTDKLYDLLGIGLCANSPFPPHDMIMVHSHWDDTYGGIRSTPSVPSYREL